MKHALSFDIEDWFHIVEIPELEDRSKWDTFPSIVEEKTDLILEILNEYDVKATFFVLGWIAKKYPSIAKKIAENGHELGTHSFWHRKVYEMSQDEFYEDLKQSIDIIRDQSGAEVKGYRAPSFSITPGTEWALKVMSELGLEYDASLFPASRSHGGYKLKQGPQMLDKNLFGNTFPELPMSMMTFGSMNIPFSGGGYLRFWPEWWLKYGFRQLEKKGLPGVIYLHPRDFAPECPRVEMPLHRRFKCYTGLETTERKLIMLLNNFQFDTCENVLKEQLSR